MKVGILTKNSVNVFSNGCNQQALFVYKTINEIPDKECYLLTEKQHTLLNINTLYFGNDLNVLLNMDVIIFLSEIEIGLLKLLEKNNVKLVAYNCENMYKIIQEDIVFDKHNWSIDLEYWDNIEEQWHTPNYEANMDFYRAFTGLSSKTIPYVWDKDIIIDWMEKNSDITYCKDRQLYSDTKYILVLESNIQTTKTCLMPLLICNELYKSCRNIKVLCMCQLKTKAFNRFKNNLEIHKDNKVEYYDRLVFFNVLSQLKTNFQDIYILSHNDNNPLNILHLETLYLKYPLVHNTSNYKNAGYYYSTIPEGVNQLKYAISNHAQTYGKYEHEANKILLQYSPYNTDNVNEYNCAIQHLFADNSHYISLGNDCTFASSLTELNLKEESLPFDWIICESFNTMIDLLENRFSNFIDKKHLIKIDNTSGARIIDNHIMENSKYKNPYSGVRYKHSIYNITFIHDFAAELSEDDAFTTVNEKYKRRINRMYNILEKSNKHIKFILYYPDITNEGIDRLNCLMKNINPKLTYSLNIITNNELIKSRDNCNILYINEKVNRLWDYNISNNNIVKNFIKKIRRD